MHFQQFDKYNNRLERSLKLYNIVKGILQSYIPPSSRCGLNTGHAAGIGNTRISYMKQLSVIY